MENDQPIGQEGYCNKNCWLVKNLNRYPYERCQYCDLEFHNCLFLRYQIISMVSMFGICLVAFLIERKISLAVVASSVILIVVNGFFFNKSTENLVRAYFAQKKAKESSEKLVKILQAQEEDLTRFYKLTVGRELRMAELKQKIKKIEGTAEEGKDQQGLPPAV